MSTEKPSPEKAKNATKATETEKPPEKEIGGYADAGLKDPTRYGDWEVKGRCSDF